MNRTMLPLAAAMAAFCAAHAGQWHVAADGSDAADGSSASSPLATFAAAFAKCSAGDEVVAADGTYEFSAPATIPNGVTVRSASGDPAAAILDGGGATPIFETGACANAMNVKIAGFTFRNARNSVYGSSGLMESGGGAIRFANPTNNSSSASLVTNCIFVSCHSDTGYGGAIMVPGGTTVARCVFTNCTAMMKGEDGTAAGLGARGGGAIYAVAKTADVAIDDCLFIDCGASNGVGVVNCGYYKGAANVTASSGGEAWFGANAYGAVLRRCAFTNNWSYGSSGCLNFKCRRAVDCIFSGTKTHATTLKDGTAKIPGATVWGAESIGITQTFNAVPSNRQIEFTGCIFDHNETMYANTTTDTPGVIHYQNNSTSYIRVPLVISNCVFTANSANGMQQSGGIVCLNEQHALTVKDTVFKGNTVKKTGLKSNAAARFPVLGCLSKNKAIVFERCRFEGNSCMGTDGGCLWLGGSNASGGSTRIENCSFVANRRGIVSGSSRLTGLIGFYEAPANVTIRGCLFACNTNACSASRSDTLVALNSYNNASTIGSGCVVESCTFVGNYINFAMGTAKCGIVHSGSAAKATVRNNVFVNNVRPGGSISPSVTCGETTVAAGGYDEAAADVTYNVEDGSILRTTVAKTDDGTGETVLTDYHNIVGTKVQFKEVDGSEYVPGKGAWTDSGLTCSWMANAKDINGAPRIYGPGPDRGCAEYVYPSGFNISIR